MNVLLWPTIYSYTYVYSNIYRNNIEHYINIASICVSLKASLFDQFEISPYIHFVWSSRAAARQVVWTSVFVFFSRHPYKIMIAHNILQLMYIYIIVVWCSTKQSNAARCTAQAPRRRTDKDISLWRRGALTNTCARMLRSEWDRTHIMYLCVCVCVYKGAFREGCAVY